MWKSTVILLFCWAFLAYVSTIPVSEFDSKIADEIRPEISNNLQHSEHYRVRRFTCDVLSVEAKGVKLNHAACGVHCLLRGKTGGWCDGRRVCRCR
ncbi:unnamed protein product [Phyllotreta striolata]|uniref:Invertebrate defensins family profile domain-containing protein n=1 Tax=Phyllotreta striolata TaxID=444603 RepID=A0A9N9T941_PHYSR|nr:unnamed protein product [Phyllotreta striolata]